MQNTTKSMSININQSINQSVGEIRNRHAGRVASIKIPAFGHGCRTNLAGAVLIEAVEGLAVRGDLVLV